MIVKSILLILTTTLILTACLKEKAEPNLSELTCTPTSFINDVMPILNNYSCTSSSCHSTSAASNGVILDTYAGVANVNTARLLGSIEQSQGYKAMPLSGKLNATEINTIKCWMKDGKQNN